MNTYKIWAPVYGETVDDHGDFNSVYDDLEYVAEDFADYYHDNCDGWECSWPITFHIADENGKLLGVVEVDRETRPSFVGKVVK